MHFWSFTLALGWFCFLAGLALISQVHMRSNKAKVVGDKLEILSDSYPQVQVKENGKEIKVSLKRKRQKPKKTTNRTFSLKLRIFHRTKPEKNLPEKDGLAGGHFSAPDKTWGEAKGEIVCLLCLLHLFFPQKKRSLKEASDKEAF